MDKSTVINVLTWLMYLGAGGSILSLYILVGHMVKESDLPLMEKIVMAVFAYGVMTMLLAFMAITVIEFK